VWRFKVSEIEKLVGLDFPNHLVKADSFEAPEGAEARTSSYEITGVDDLE
jgi:hypothetical protein